jgi:hypothetical protein
MGGESYCDVAGEVVAEEGRPSNGSDFHSGSGGPRTFLGWNWCRSVY